ncbi:MAG TPA: YceH family protein [Acidimicrobiales bacterium]|nr:YceH family protein [Acidimicrobiales bacterium]
MEPLSPEELRVLGALVEKEAATPDQYPLTLNALVLACNQTSNRSPVVAYSPGQVSAALDRLRARKLARVVHSPSNRADKYRHVADETWGLTRAELAVLAVLALRGPQTVNELRTRTERYPSLDDLGGVEGVLHRLRNRYDDPYVVRLERRPGQREERWAHLLAGEVIEVPDAAAAPVRSATADRLAVLEQEVTALRAQVTALAGQVAEVRQLLE